MVKKLKCWRRESKTSYKRTTGQKLFIGDFKGGGVVMIAPEDSDEADIIKHFDTESKALKFAKSYMKKHNIC